MRMRALVWVDYRGLDCRLLSSAVRFWVSLLTSLAVVVRSALVAAGSPNRLAGTLTMAQNSGSTAQHACRLPYNVRSS